MDIALLKRESNFEWHVPQTGKMNVPGIIYATEDLICDMDNKVLEQLTIKAHGNSRQELWDRVT